MMASKRFCLIKLIYYPFHCVQVSYYIRTSYSPAQHIINGYRQKAEMLYVTSIRQVDGKRKCYVTSSNKIPWIWILFSLTETNIVLPVQNPVYLLWHHLIDQNSRRRCYDRIVYLTKTSRLVPTDDLWWLVYAVVFGVAFLVILMFILIVCCLENTQENK